MAGNEKLKSAEKTVAISPEVAGILEELKEEIKVEAEKPPEKVEEEIKEKIEVMVFSEEECESLIMVVYSFLPIMWKIPEYQFPKDAIRMRARQLALILKRYGITIKYLDVVFLGAGVAADVLGCYAAARAKKAKEVEEK